MRYFQLFIVALFFIGCETKPQIESVDLTAVENVLINQLDTFHSAMKANDIDAYKIFLTDDGLFCGTDPEELWGKEKLVSVMAEAMDNESIVFNYSVDKREIRVDADGNSATILEQFTVKWISEKIPIRFVAHFVKIGADWKIDFFSWSMVPKNDDLNKLNKALE